MIYDLLATTLRERAGIQLHTGKTRTWQSSDRCLDSLWYGGPGTKKHKRDKKNDIWDKKKMTNGTKEQHWDKIKIGKPDKKKRAPKPRMVGEGCGPTSGWAPKGGRPKPRKVGPPKGGHPRVGAPPKGGGPKISRFFFPSPPKKSFFSSFSWGSFRGILVGFLKRRGPEMCTFGVLGLSCASPAARSGGAAGDSPRAQMCTFHGSGFQNTSTRRHPKERRKNENCAGREKKKIETLAVQGKGGPAEGGPAEDGRGSTQIFDQTHTTDTHRGVRRNRSCGGRRKVVRTHKTAHNTHTTHTPKQNNSTQQHNNTTTTHKPHKPHNNTHTTH